jgi:hypothetical protein
MRNYEIGKNPNSLKNLRPSIPQIHEEPKRARLSAYLTPTGKQGVKKIAQEYNLSMSELIELIGRGEFDLVKKAS